MKIPLRSISANPFRDELVYPVSRRKLEDLKVSIRTTGFWDNLIGRNADGCQLAYGYHRLLALRELVAEHVLDWDFEIEVQIRKLDDGAMVRIMAAESRGECPPIIDATIHAVRMFVARRVATLYTEITADDIAMFLGSGWTGVEIKRSFRRISKKVKL